MAILFLILVAAAVFHFIFEGILAPSLRYSLRLKLFALRDRLRNLEDRCGPEAHDGVCALLEDSINGTIRHLHLINAHTFVRADREVEQNPALKQALIDRHRQFESCPIDEVREIRGELIHLSKLAFMTNHGGWSYLIIFPIIFQVVKQRWFKRNIRAIPYLREQEMEEIAPQIAMT